MTKEPVQVNEDAQKAREYRTAVGLGLSGPVPDLLHVVEDVAGVAVSVIPLPATVSGAYAIERGQPFVFLNQGHAAVRQRFTLAHELAHHVFGDDGALDTEASIFGRPESRIEQRATTFAAEFLVPLQAVQAWMTARGDAGVTLRTVVELAAYFRVSAQTALIRLELARFLAKDSRLARELSTAIDSGDHLRLARRLGVTEAPDELDRIHESGAPRLPGRMWEYAVNGYEHRLLTVERVAQALHRDPDEVRAELEELGASTPADDPDY